MSDQAVTPEERARSLGFELAPIRAAARRLRTGSVIALVVGGVAILFAVFPGGLELRLGSAALGFVLGFAAPVITFVAAQIVVRLFVRSRMSAVAIATAPATTLLASLLLLGAFALAPRDASGFAGLLMGTWLAGTIDVSGHAAVARVFDRDTPVLETTAKWLHEYPAWSTIAAGRMGWLLVFAIVGSATSVAALLVFRDAPVAIAPVVAALALGSAAEAWATIRDRLAIRALVAFAVLGAALAAWLLLR
jgi:hypothetical protein